MAKKSQKIEGTTEAWESGELGRDEEFVKVSTDINQDALDDSLELQMISIRLQKSLIEDIKMIAELNGFGYQPLIRQTLNKFVECEKRTLLRQAARAQAQDNGDKAAVA
ncbi:MAG: hypothetical protein COB33_002345 [Thiotrichaceae bacterium]|nr:hypothetical protein [Thiotrichaceae bacterium]PCI14147.1 MAG: hypothetical protein COB71_04085 [Thiotrichales bacterium]